MKMNKQTIQILVLSGLMLVLIFYAVMAYGGKGTPTPAPRSNPAASGNATGTDGAPVEDASAAKKKGNPADLLWIDTERLADVVKEVNGGRDPFEDLMMPVKPVVSNSNTNENKNNFPAPSTNITPLPAIDEKISQQVKLVWLIASEVKKLLAKENFTGLKVKAINDNSHTITLTGMRIDIDDALKIIGESDKEPPKPKFRLIGVLKTSEKSFVVLAVDGQQYELYVGDTINKLGWSVAAINASGIRLTKGRQTLLLPIGGQP